MDELNEEQKALLRQRQTDLLKLLGALEKLEESKEWNIVKEIVFDPSLVSIEKQILSESLASKIDTDKLYKLQGEWAWAKQHADTKRFISTLKVQLQDIKNRLK